MILNRYFLKSIFSYTASVSVIFLLIIVSSRSIQYLEQAARGEINPEAVFWIILFRLPEFGQIILPLSFFISIVLTLGKLRSESEFVVMEQNGFTFKRMHSLLIACSAVICAVIFSLSAWLTPKLDLQIKDMIQQKTLKEKIISLTPGEFHKLNESTIVYSKENPGDNLTEVFIKNNSTDNRSREFFIFAEKAYVAEITEEVIHLNDGSVFFLDEVNELSKLTFEEMKLRIDPESNNTLLNEEDSDIQQSSNITWLLSLCTMTIISIFLAVPLSKINPREGRYKRILPALLVFSFYLGLLIASRGTSELSSVTQITSMALIHLVFLIIALYLYFRTKQTV